MPKRIENMDHRTVAAYLPPDLARRARIHAKETGRSLSSLMVEAVTAYFARLDLIEAVERDTLQQPEADAAEQISAEQSE